MKKITLMIQFTLISFCLMLVSPETQSQIAVQGLVSDNEGAASWNADGSGPEPYGVGHSTFTYYIASRDYVNPAAAAGAHVTSIGTDFPLFAQALTDNGFTPGQVIVKLGLASLGNDLEGEDWFTFGNEHHLNFYPTNSLMTLNGEPMISGITNYMMFNYGVSTGWIWQMESNFFVPADASGNSSAAVKAVAAAFLLDVAGHELRFNFQSLGSTVPFTGNGRTGSYRNISGNIEKGLPEIPMLGLRSDHEGGAAWDADGSGTEPYGNGHSTFTYYAASVDYDDLDPSPDAALCHLLNVEKGFQNTLLQLQYRGYEIGDIKIKMGLVSLGPDVEGEDWGMENGHSWLNEYNNLFTFELNGEPILQMLCDTNKLISYATYWTTHSSIGKLYDISQNASVEAQYVAQSFLKDIGTHYIEMFTGEMSPEGYLNGNGRSGSFYSMHEASLVALHDKATFLPEGNLAGTLTLDGSPYYIEGHQLIENGTTLTIDPGVRIGVRGPYHFGVQGCLKAEGTADHNILFTSSNPNLWWDGLDFDETPAGNDTSRFDHCIFQYGLGQGTAPQYNSGGAMAGRNVDKIKIQNTVFRHNKAVLSGLYPPCGGAMAFENSDILIHNCTFYDNLAGYGGAVFCYLGSDPTISRCLFYNNSAENDGGAIQVWDNSDPLIINNTFSLNNAGSNGGAMDVYSFSNPVLVNNIFWGNEANVMGQQISITSNNCNVSITYCDVQGGESGIGPYGIQSGNYENNIDKDPVFVDPLTGDFNLDLDLSPCINAGDPSMPDPDGTAPEMGCYYYPQVGVYHHAVGELKLFPNPASSVIVIVNDSPANADARIEVFNAMGQQANEYRIISATEHEIIIDVSHLQHGTWFCKRVSGEDVRIAKFIKK